MIPAMKCPVKAANQLSWDGKQATTLQGHSYEDGLPQCGPVWPGQVTQGARLLDLQATLGPSSPLCCMFTQEALKLMFLSPSPLDTAHQCSEGAWGVDDWVEEGKMIQMNQWYSQQEKHSSQAVNFKVSCFLKTQSHASLLEETEAAEGPRHGPYGQWECDGPASGLTVLKRGRSHCHLREVWSRLPGDGIPVMKGLLAPDWRKPMKQNDFCFPHSHPFRRLGIYSSLQSTSITPCDDNGMCMCTEGGIEFLSLYKWY